ncbi:MAG: hypothetical protein OEY67_10485, partial [Gammaproteobacteria bacterium]|nr:hypothetical protein [Gammaproteobacteria bacterium]
DGFTIQTPLNGSSFMPTTEAITLTWSPAGSADQMSVHIDLRCTDGGLFTSRINISGDPGVYTVMPEEFVLMFPDFQAQCTSYIRLARTRPGELDPAFGGGIVSGRQERRVQLTLIP